MTKFVHKGNLLEDLAESIGVPFISELKLPENRNYIYECVRQTRAEDYPVDQWTDAADYLIGRKMKGRSAEDIRKAILVQ